MCFYGVVGLAVDTYIYMQVVYNEHVCNVVMVILYDSNMFKFPHAFHGQFASNKSCYGPHVP